MAIVATRTAMLSTSATTTALIQSPARPRFRVGSVLSVVGAVTEAALAGHRSLRLLVRTSEVMRWGLVGSAHGGLPPPIYSRAERKRSHASARENAFLSLNPAAASHGGNASFVGCAALGDGAARTSACYWTCSSQPRTSSASSAPMRWRCSVFRNLGTAAPMGESGFGTGDSSADAKSESQR